MEKAVRKVQEFKAREQEILNTALELLLDHGDEKVTVEAIAEKVGIGKGTIYKHFDSKSEIYLRLMIDYERGLAERLNVGIEDAKSGDGASSAAALTEYFAFRVGSPEKDHLFHVLEQKMINLNEVPEMVQELHDIRNSTLDSLGDLISERIAGGGLEDVPPYFHWCAAWALTHGAVALYNSTSFADRIKDRDAMMQFIMEIGIRMGNKGQLRRSPQDKGAPAGE